MATVASYYANAALKGARRQGENIDLLLAQAGISQELLLVPDTRVHDNQLSQLIRSIWESLGDEFMGFTRHGSKPGTFAMMCQLVTHCANLEALLRQGVQFYYLVTDDIVMDLSFDRGDAILTVTMAEPELDPEHFFLEFWLVIWHRFSSWMIGKQIKLKQAHFTYAAPGDKAEFSHLFPCERCFNMPSTCLRFSETYLKEPLMRTSREIAHFLKNSPADFMTIPGTDDSYSARIKALILQQMAGTLTFPRFETLSHDLHMSPQTLRRRLQAEGSSYQQLKDTIRRDMAIEKLSVQGLTITEVATLLGFAEPRSFTRAFKQWTGASPSSYRQIVTE